MEKKYHINEILEAVEDILSLNQKLNKKNQPDISIPVDTEKIISQAEKELKKRL
tara:strand:- start:218 stop:379 length:162 start_codon:yes stop_codon:yes gene_type:complete